jgi:hypothetical protein
VKQLNVFCEGPTEQHFCSQVLQPHLFPQGDGQVHTLPVGVKDYRHVFGVGRGNNYRRIRSFILNTIKGRAGRNVYFTTLIDLYALPRDFPGKDANVRSPADPTPYVVALERSFAEDIGHFRFIPHLQLHEYETMLFSNLEAFRISFENCAAAIRKLESIVASVPSLEHINDGRDTAPSKRIIEVLPEYEGRKSSAGPDIAEYIGLTTIRSKCPHFHGWLDQLERLSWEAD